MIKISPSTLNLFTECPRCFWLLVNKGIRRPQGPMSSLPSGIDYVLKYYYDHWRGKRDLPPIFDDKNLDIQGRLAEQKQVNHFRSRSFGYNFKDLDVWFTGMLDDALVLADGSIIPLDNKTRGFPPKETHQAHINQMGSYTLLLQKNGYKTKNIAYLVHWFTDHRNVDLSNPLGFNIAVEKVDTDPKKIVDLLNEATKILKMKEPPLGSDCGFCNYWQSLNESIDNVHIRSKNNKIIKQKDYPKDSLFNL